MGVESSIQTLCHRHIRSHTVEPDLTLSGGLTPPLGVSTRGRGRSKQYCCPADIAANNIRNGSFALEGRNVLKQGGECFDRSIRVGVKHGG